MVVFQIQKSKLHFPLVSNPFFKLSSPLISLIPFLTPVFLLHLQGSESFLQCYSYYLQCYHYGCYYYCYCSYCSVSLPDCCVESRMSDKNIRPSLVSSENHWSFTSIQYNFKKLVRIKSDHRMQDIGCVTAENSSGRQLEKIGAGELKTITRSIKRYQEIFFGTKEMNMMLKVSGVSQ